MISYNTKDWLSFIFQLHRGDTFRKLFFVLIAVALYGSGIYYVEIIVLRLHEKNYLEHVTTLHTILGLVISMLLVFRTNTAYDRWWEGRKLWGALVNSSRNLALKLASILDAEDDRAFFRKTIPLYAATLQQHLSDEKIAKELFDDAPVDVDLDKHAPNQVAAALFSRINSLYKVGNISDAQLIIINDQITALTDICGGCERIKNTPIPYSYSAFIKKFIVFYVLSMPFGYAFHLGYYVGIVTALVFYVLASLELIAEEIEDPFGNDDNDLPLKKIAANIDHHIGELL